MPIPEYLQESAHLYYARLPDLAVRWLTWPAREFTTEASADDSVGVAVLLVGDVPSGILYAHVRPSLGAALPWRAVATALLERLGRHTEHAEAVARFVAASVGPTPEQLDAFMPPVGTLAAGDPAASTWANTEERLRCGHWGTPILDLSSGTTTRNVKAFAPAYLGGSPEGLSLRTRIRFGDDLMSDSPEEQAEEQALAERGARRAGVPLPLCRRRPRGIDINYYMSLEDIFRLRAARAELGEYAGEPELWYLADVLSPSSLEPDAVADYHRWVGQHLAKMEAAWSSRPRRGLRSGPLPCSPIYGGTTIPTGAGFGGFDPKAVKRVLRSRIDDVGAIEQRRAEAASPDDDMDDEGRVLVLRSEAERRRVQVWGDFARASVELLATMCALGLAESPKGPFAADWTPTTEGRRLARTSTARYRRSNAVAAVVDMLARAEAINADPEALYRIDALVVFGSLVSGTGDAIGDVDVGVSWVPRITDPQAFHRAREARDEVLNEASGWRFHWWMHVNLTRRELEQRLRGGTPVLQLSDWTQINATIRTKEAQMELIVNGIPVPDVQSRLASLRPQATHEESDASAAPVPAAVRARRRRLP